MGGAFIFAVAATAAWSGAAPTLSRSEDLSTLLVMAAVTLIATSPLPPLASVVVVPLALACVLSRLKLFEWV